MYEVRIHVSSLKGIQFLYENDLYELASLIIRLNNAKNKGMNMITLQTVYGLAHTYSTIAGVSCDKVESVMNASGLPSGAVIVADHL